MLDNIIRFSIRNKLVIAVFTLALIAWGTWSASKLPVDALPDITNNQVQILTKAPTLAAQEVEQFITYPVEKAMGNLPDLTEIRSFSRFGISVITLVFKESTNIYFSRQLIAEKLNEVQESIPEGLGKPEMAPMTTGLGEIYQYIIHPKKGSESKYSAMDLRTFQDWIVSRQLYGIAGVAEITGFGGISKQYEVAINPNKLKSLGITIPDVFNALEKNNQNTGGAYIDKKPNAYFIRGVGLMTSVADIENTVVKKMPTGVPILIKNVATVGFGSPPRFGALTYNGEKEVVGGIVLMVKGANSADVAGRVKERMITIQKSLPPDVVIEPFLDRTDLIDRAIFTVQKNLIEGALIVIFVLVVFLGNFRAGFIVASAIPLSLLFALGMMHLFGISANLMSLGAIDFGLIVDGAVIIVEATMHHLAQRKKIGRFTQQEMDEEVFQSASKIRSSAAFGEIIILVVYIPILTLIGVEGKMFRPMAQTVGFAILGALILSLTYIPMMSALFLSKNAVQKRTFSDRMMEFLQRKYHPILKAAIRAKYLVIAGSVVLLIGSILIFNRMGGEFIPQLEEGDFAIEFVLPQGTSLSQSTETVLQAQRMLRKYPEVKMVVGKTGSADVATDPMPPEATDMMVILKDKSEWTTTKDFYELADMMGETLSAIPGVIAEPSQPIQMRFNELMTGIRQDVAVKIFGENMDTLNIMATEVANAIRRVEGITQPQVERVSGLPQITVRYDRSRLAGYGLNIEDVNQVISTAFAGGNTGAIYENERRFDLVVRLDSGSRSSIENVADLFVPTPDGNQVPLSQVATVAYETGPAQISREDGRRRIVVSFNVSGRDVESVVEEVQEVLNKKVKLPPGYYYTYGGTFESLRQASDRLMIAVPGALLLIFILLFFTFKSFKQASLIFTAIPMSAIGGIFALLIRDMPFSISAGVGFIALFGVAVLNGIVLIGTFNQLEKEGVTDIVERVFRGTRERLRPVLMTATVASLGFLPMALSSSAGAEVQRPLATVVIGGLISATILTLIVLPLLYMLFNKTKISASLVKPALIILLLVGSLQVSAQNAPTSRLPLDSVYNMALKSNLLLKSGALQIEQRKLLAGTGVNIPKTGVFVENEDFTPTDSKGILKIGISQSIDWPGLYSAQKSLLKEQVRSVELAQEIQKLAIKRDIDFVYYNLWYLENKQLLWKRLDSIYTSFASAAILRVKTGESAGLDSISAKAKSAEMRLQLTLIFKDIVTEQEKLKRLLNTSSAILPVNSSLPKISVIGLPGSFEDHPEFALQRQNISIADAEINVSKQKNMPSFEGRFFSQRLYGITPPFSGFSVTVGLPIFGRAASKNAIKAAELEKRYQQALSEYGVINLTSQYQQVASQLQKSDALIGYYKTTGLAQAESIIKAATLSYKSGEISFAELSQFISQAIDIQRNYLEVLNEYNQSAINLNYFTRTN
ncbi:MAG: CusA/CzcA family heavy metal efflux RND transporter [Sphingobacteriales bacterium]|nr:MAG: CusA/CzcA family heavy metal efflux RND transporter [Sphingobacteriales bacterium]